MFFLCLVCFLLGILDIIAFWLGKRKEQRHK